jgi:hypothetical protein
MEFIKRLEGKELEVSFGKWAPTARLPLIEAADLVRGHSFGPLDSGRSGSHL